MKRLLLLYLCLWVKAGRHRKSVVLKYLHMRGQDFVFVLEIRHNMHF